MRGFIAGVLLTLIVLVVGGYVFIRSGKLSMATTAKPLPFEQAIASAAIEGSIANGKNVLNPLPVTDENIVAGAKEYREHCVFCHGAPQQKKPPLAAMMFPHPPQLFEKDTMVTDDPPGSIFWIVTNGIRLSAMPGFKDHLTDTERWQIATLLGHADKLPPVAITELQRQEPGEPMAPGHMH